jgi:hypothetical protein
MLKITRTHVTSAILAATLALPVAAFAQTTTTPGAAPGTTTMPSASPDNAGKVGTNSTSGAQTSDTKTSDTKTSAQTNATQTGGAMATTAEMKPEDVRARVEQRIADLHETLHITKAQETRFNDFAQVMLDNAQSFETERMKRTTPPDNLTAEQSLKDYAQMTEMHARNVEKLSKAFDRLYSDLSPEQKRDADQAFRTAAAERQQQKTGG